ncbi:MAG: PGPGW domain-containing protein [Bifidobacteriaceae bacterium]|nr:PGPGW domain-containing protein [Bifidobacteriaceae bacterium]
MGAPTEPSARPSTEPPDGQRPGWRRSLARFPRLERAYRIGVGAVGGVLTAAGIVLLVLPGPGIALLFAGLAILATEFGWAARPLRWLRNRARRSRKQLRPDERDP